MLIWPNSGTASELGEVGWTDAARQSSIVARQSRALYAKGVSRRPRVAKAAAPAPAPRAPKAPGRPKRQGETKNDRGERVVNYNDGSTVTVHGDGSATHRTKDGIERKGTYKDPTPKVPNTDPEGFSVPKPRAAAAPRQPAPERPPRQVRLVKPKLSRTRKGPRSGSLPHAY